MVLLAGLAAPAMAQDSISRNSDGGNGLPGDGLSPWTTGAAGYQRTTYVVDLAQLNPSWGQQVLGIAPVIKTSKTSSLFFGSLFSANGLSATARVGVPAASSAYELWSNAPRAGVNREENERGAITVTPGPASTQQFGVIMSEFATTDLGISANNILTGVINVDPNAPGRLFVTRTVAATNHTPPNGDNSQFGVGAVDSDGNAYFRVDAFGSIGTNPILGNNLFRVDSLARNINLNNEISQAGGVDAAVTARLVNNYGNSVNTPSAIPEQISPPGVIIGANFDGGYFHGGTVPATTLPGGVHRPGTTDHRGAPHFYPFNLLNAPGAVGTAGMLTITGNNTNTITLWPVQANGAPIPANARNFTLPGAVTDPVSISPYSISFPGGSPSNRFEHYGSQTFARGSAPISIGRDTQGRTLVGGVAYVRTNGLALISPANAVIVGRAEGTSNRWVVAAWTNGNGTGSFPSSDLTKGKEILGDGGLDGVIGTGDPGDSDGILDLNPASPTYDAPIGRLANPHERGGTQIGPSIGGVSFDSYGNAFFNSTVVLKKFDRATQTFFDDFDTALIRANYDPASFSYRLELILELGNVFTGPNSGTPYQVQFLDVADSNSVSSGTTWGNATAPFAFNNLDPATLDPRDSRLLGGVVVGAEIVYDVDGDGQFVDPTGNSSNPDSVDESYNVLLYIGHRGDGAGTCPGQGPGSCGPGDWNEDGVIDFNDLLAFLNDYNAQTECSDVNGDGTVDFNDLLEFLNRYNAGC
jgi:hypothetical protein